MNFIVFFIHLPFVYSELHIFVATYVKIRDLTFFAATTLDGQQIGYYDINQKKLVPNPDWVKRIESKPLRKEDTIIIDNVQKIYINNIFELIKQLHGSKGVHTYQGRHGCTSDKHTFHDYAYDGENFITLDMTTNKYKASVPEAIPIVEKWNNDREHIKTLKEYYDFGCNFWLKRFIRSTKTAFGGTVPEVSLLQKSPDAVVKCHVTGFYSNNIVLLWMKNGQDLNNPALMEFGRILPNGDGTFQRTATLRVSPDDWRKEQYTCVVKYMNKTILRSLTEDEIKSNYRDSSIPVLVYIICAVVALVIAVCGLFFWHLVNNNGQICGEPCDLCQDNLHYRVHLKRNPYCNCCGY